MQGYDLFDMWLSGKGDTKKRSNSRRPLAKVEDVNNSHAMGADMAAVSGKPTP